MTWHHPFSFVGSPIGSRSPRAAGASRSIRLRLEQLEDRLVLSTGMGPNQAFVNQVYQDLTGQPADPQSLATWSAAVQSGVPLPFVVYLIEQTPAYHGAEIDRAYSTFLNRAPSASEQLLGQTFLASGGTEIQLQALLAGSPEFYLGSGSNNLGFLQRLYNDALGIQNFSSPTLEPAIEQWLGVMSSGVSPVQVAYAVLDGGEYLGQQIGNTFSYLGQSPSTDEVQALLQLALPSSSLDGVNALLLGSPTFFVSAQSPSQAILVSMTSTTGNGNVSLQANVSSTNSAGLSGGSMMFTFTPSKSGQPIRVTVPLQGNNLSASAQVALTGQDYTLTVQYNRPGGTVALNSTYSITFQDDDAPPSGSHPTDIHSPDSTKTTFDDTNDQLKLVG